MNSRFWFIRHFDNEDKVHNSVGNDVPKSVLSRFYSLYLEKQEDVSGNNGGAVKYVMSARKKDLLASYILVLCLFIERDLTIDPLSIAPDLKIERSKCVLVEAIIQLTGLFYSPGLWKSCATSGAPWFTSRATGTMASSSRRTQPNRPKVPQPHRPLRHRPQNAKCSVSRCPSTSPSRSDPSSDKSELMDVLGLVVKISLT